MKKYTSVATKWLAVFALIHALVFLTGIILTVAGSSNSGLQIGLTEFGGFMSILLLGCCFAEKSRYLTIDGDIIVLPRGAVMNEKTVFERTAIKINEFASLESKFYKGDKIITRYCFFYTVKLKDGAKITFTLYAYGKEAEKEIIETIQNRL